MRVTGFCPWSPQRIAEALNQGLAPSGFPGDFVVTAKGRDEETPFELVLSSALCCRNYFYAAQGTTGRVVHGPDLFEVARRADRRWRWNWHAVMELAVTEFVTADSTLHADVRKMPPATRVIIRDEHADWESEPFWETIFPARRSDLHDSLTVLRSSFDDLQAKPAALSLSGGLDSRVLLAELLRRGERPLVGTMGFPHSGDLRAAKAISTAYGLEHRIVTLRPDQYLAHAREITRVTAGLKTANHWHTFLYMREVDFPTDHLHYAGSNGEFVRTPWYDYHPWAAMADRLMPELDCEIVRQRFKSGPYSARFQAVGRLTGRLDIPAADHRGMPDRFVGQCVGAGAPLERLDRFIALNPIRNFIGTGISIYSHHLPTFSPFLDSRWMAQAAGLPRTAKLGSRFHRYAIEQSYPDLLRFDVGDGRPLGRSPRWSHRPQKRRQAPYADFRAVTALEAVREICCNSPHLTTMFGADVLSDQRIHQEFAGFLIAIHFAAECASEEGLL